MKRELTNAEKLRGLPWSIASGSANAISAQWTFFGPPFVLLLSELGANNGRIGFLLSLFPFAGLLALVMAPAAARFGNKRTYLVFWGMRYLFAAGLLLIPWLLSRLSATGLELYVSALVLSFAICRAVAETGYYPWSQEFIPNSVRGKYYAGYYGFATLASFAAVLLASYVVGRGTGISRYMGLIAAGVFFGFLTVWLATWVPGGAPQREAAPRAGASQSMLAALGNRSFRTYLLMAALVILGSAPLASFQPLLLKNRIGLDAGPVVLVQAGVLLGGFGSGFFWGWLADRYGSKPVIMSTVLINVLVPAGWLLVPSASGLTLPAALIVAFLAGAALNGWQIGSGRLLFGSVIPPEQRTPFTAVHYAWTGVVGGAGPLVAGALLDSSTLRGRWLGLPVDPFAILLLLSAALSLGAFLVNRAVRGDSDVSFRQFLGLFLRGNPLLALETSLRYSRVEDEAAGVSLTERLGSAHSPLNLEELVEALHDPRHAVRSEAVISITRAGPDLRYTEALLQMLAGDAADLQTLAAWALGRLGDRRAIPALRGVLAGDNAVLRMQAARALGQLGDGDAIPALRAGLLAAAWDERVACASALGLLRAGAAVKDMLALLYAATGSPDRHELALSLARIISNEHYYIRLWRATRSEPGTALAQASEALRKRLRGLPPERGPLPGLMLSCADHFAADDLAQATARLCLIIQATPAQRLDSISAAVLAECGRRLAEFGSARLEYVLLAMHTLDNGITAMAAHLGHVEGTTWETQAVSGGERPA